LLADFGLSLVLSQTQSTAQSVVSSSTAMFGGTVRWMAKEFFASTSDGNPQMHSRATDVWAYGMVVYELLTWKVPYADKPYDQNVILAIATGELPAKPEDTGDPRMFDRLWNFCLSCWRESSNRPTAAEIVSFMSTCAMPKVPAVIRKPRGRTWNPATDVNAFKQEIVETLARFMRTSFGDADTDIE